MGKELTLTEVPGLEDVGDETITGPLKELNETIHAGGFGTKLGLNTPQVLYFLPHSPSDGSHLCLCQLHP